MSWLSNDNISIHYLFSRDKDVLPAGHFTKNVPEAQMFKVTESKPVFGILTDDWNQINKGKHGATEIIILGPISASADLVQ